MLKLTVLTDNTTRIEAYYLGEPAACYYIECDGSRFLFDTGYSDVYLRNAAAMRIDLTGLDGIVFSHGHSDHTRGLELLPREIRDIPVYAHPETFAPKQLEDTDIGSRLTADQIRERFDLRLSAEPMELTERLVFLGEIPRTTEFESREPLGSRLSGGAWVPDFLPDDTALAYKGRYGLTIITGCSHSGICNITEYAKQVCGDTRIAGIIGGFHLLEMSPRVDKTVEYLKMQRPGLLCPCHCTGFHARAAISRELDVTEVCVGDVFRME